MSRTRREKNPYTKCNYQWPAKGSAIVDCPHVCSLVLDHEGAHYCCRLGASE